MRNNIIDGTGSQPGYNGIIVERLGSIVPSPTNIEVYHNTIYRGDSSSDIHRGIRVGQYVTNSIVKNNLVCFPYATGIVTLVENQCSDLVSTDNVLTADAQFILPRAGNPLERDFRLQAGSSVLGKGVKVPVYDDYYLNSRPESSVDPGAFEQ